MNQELTFDDVVKAHQRLQNYTIVTPLITNKKINNELGAQIFFKMENQQIANAFKARGAFNTILAYKEKHQKFPEKIVASSSGNHAQAVAYASKKFGINALIYMASIASSYKIKATRDLGAEVILNDKRSEVNRLSAEKEQEGYFHIHPSAHPDVICGQGTAAFEALHDCGEVEAIFTPCGGGGLASGTFLAAQKLSPQAKVYACEPLNANDAARSVREGKIFSFPESPNTIADGARTLAVSEICFNYLKKMAGVLEISEEKILEWQKKLSENLEQKIEPTSALAIAGCEQYLQKNGGGKNQKILVIISGGNLA